MELMIGQMIIMVAIIIMLALQNKKLSDQLENIKKEQAKNKDGCTSYMVCPSCNGVKSEDQGCGKCGGIGFVELL